MLLKLQRGFAVKIQTSQTIKWPHIHMQASLSENDIAQILRGISIPPQPQIMADLQMAQAFDPPDLNEISQLISRDASICGSVIKVANSPYYGLGQPVTSIDQAIMLIGVDAVINTVNGVSTRQSLVDMSKLNDMDVMFLNRFWDAAEDMAKIAQLISNQLQLENPSSMYLLGLFHNAGIPLLVQAYPNYRDILAEAYALEDATITAIEDKHLNTNHAVLGYYLARSWKMPLFICDAITEHHNLQYLLSDSSSKGGPILNMLSILKLAEHLVGLHYLLGRHELDLEWLALQDLLLDYLSITHEDIDDLQQTCSEMGIGQQNPG